MEDRMRVEGYDLRVYIGLLLYFLMVIIMSLLA